MDSLSVSTFVKIIVLQTVNGHEDQTVGRVVERKVGNIICLNVFFAVVINTKIIYFPENYF